MSRLQNFLIKAFNHFFLFSVSFLFISLLFFNNSTVGYDKLRQVLFAGIIFIISALILFKISKQKAIILWLQEKYRQVIIISIILVALVQIYIISTSSTSIGWDVGIIVNAALSDNLNKISEYFSIYPNNLLLLFLFRSIAHFLGAQYIWLKLNILCILAVDISILLVFYIVRHIINIKWAYIAYCISLLTFGFFSWIIVPYSDVLAMPFTIGTYALYIEFKNSKTNGLKIRYSVLIAIINYIGYLIKPTVVIILIAIFVIEILYNINKIKQKVFHISLYALMIIVMLFSNIAWNAYIQNQNIIKIDSELKTPLTHFYMMGLNYSNGFYGAWNSKDVELTDSYKTHAKKVKANMKVIDSRLNNYGLAGYLEFLTAKARWITSEGNFFWGGEGDFAKFQIDKHSSIIQNLIYTNGNYYSYYQYFVQGIWICLMFLCAFPFLLNIINRKSEDDMHISLVRCTIFGIILFILLFEGRSRYLILYLPFFCILATSGIKGIVNYITKFKRQKYEKA